MAVLCNSLLGIFHCGCIYTCFQQYNNMEIPDKNDLESIYLCSMAVALSDTMYKLDYPCRISLISLMKPFY